MSKIFRRRKPKAKQKTAKEFAFRKIGLRKIRRDLREIEKLLSSSIDGRRRSSEPYN